ncbi:hypothetical protein [Leptospira barantonii]
MKPFCNGIAILSLKKRFRFLPKSTKRLLNLGGLTTKGKKMFNSEYIHKKIKEPIQHQQHAVAYQWNSDSSRNGNETETGLKGLESKTKQVKVRPDLYDK